MGACTEYLIDVLAHTWDLAKRIIVYCGIYYTLFPCMGVNRSLITRGHLVRFISVDTSGLIDSVQFMKILTYYWSSKYIDKDFYTFKRLLKQHINIIPSHFSVIVYVDQLPSNNKMSIGKYIEINVSISEHTVNVTHRVDPKNTICQHEIEDSYGFDLIDILDFAIGRSKCALLRTK